MTDQNSGEDRCAARVAQGDPLGLAESEHRVGGLPTGDDEHLDRQVQSDDDARRSSGVSEIRQGATGAAAEVEYGVTGCDLELLDRDHEAGRIVFEALVPPFGARR